MPGPEVDKLTTVGLKGSRGMRQHQWEQWSFSQRAAVGIEHTWEQHCNEHSRL